MANSINATSTGNGGIITTGDDSGVLNIQTNETTAVTITATQNVGVGTASPAAKLHVKSSNGVVISESTGDVTASGTTYLGLNDANGQAAYIGYGGDGAGVMSIWNRKNGATIFATNNTEQARITSTGLMQFNSGYGSVATAYGCRAWVNFNGQGTVAIRASGNVSSITDNGTGDYTVNFTTAMPDVNYDAVINATYADTNSSQDTVACAYGFSTSSVKVTSGYPAARRDNYYVGVAIFR
jgi:hypothetical protein